MGKMNWLGKKSGWTTSVDPNMEELLLLLPVIGLLETGENISPGILFVLFFAFSADSNPVGWCQLGNWK